MKRIYFCNRTIHVNKQRKYIVNGSLILLNQIFLVPYPEVKIHQFKMKEEQNQLETK